MGDRELLELAAKAAGIEVQFHKTMISDYRFDLGELPYTRKPHGPLEWRKRHDDWCVPWNPLTDDGDALRLAVKLRLHVGLELHAVSVWHPLKPIAGVCVEHIYESDADAATRRAIVRAAAVIGQKTNG